MKHNEVVIKTVSKGDDATWMVNYYEDTIKLEESFLNNMLKIYIYSHKYFSLSSPADPNPGGLEQGII